MVALSFCKNIVSAAIEILIFAFLCELIAMLPIIMVSSKKSRIFQIENLMTINEISLSIQYQNNYSNKPN